MSAPDISVDELAARLSELAAQVEDLQAAIAGTADADGDEAPVRQPRYPSVESWVEQFFAAAYYRPVAVELRWCRRWFEHPEALIRLELLWRSWEVYRLRPLGAVEWHDVLDRQLPVLLSEQGPFATCTPDRHEPPRTLPVSPPPAGWFDTNQTPGV